MHRRAGLRSQLDLRRRHVGRLLPTDCTRPRATDRHCECTLAVLAAGTAPNSGHTGARSVLSLLSFFTRRRDVAVTTRGSRARSTIMGGLSPLCLRLPANDLRGPRWRRECDVRRWIETCGMKLRTQAHPQNLDTWVTERLRRGDRKILERLENAADKARRAGIPAGISLWKFLGSIESDPFLSTT